MPPPRKFDHEEALRLFTEEEWTVPEIARRMAVSDAPVRLVCDPSYRDRCRESSRRWGKRGACIDCGATIWRRRQSSDGPRLRCRACNAKAHATTVRDTELRCSECGAWKPDTDFPRAKGRLARRERHGVCRGCQAASRQRRRLARRVPCVRCGELRLDHRDGGYRGRDTGLCRACYWEELRRTGGIANARKIAA